MASSALPENFRRTQLSKTQGVRLGDSSRGLMDFGHEAASESTAIPVSFDHWESLPSTAGVVGLDAAAVAVQESDQPISPPVREVFEQLPDAGEGAVIASPSSAPPLSPKAPSAVLLPRDEPPSPEWRLHRAYIDQYPEYLQGLVRPLSHHYTEWMSGLDHSAAVTSQRCGHSDDYHPLFHGAASRTARDAVRVGGIDEEQFMRIVDVARRVVLTVAASQQQHQRPPSGIRQQAAVPNAAPSQHTPSRCYHPRVSPPPPSNLAGGNGPPVNGSSSSTRQQSLGPKVRDGNASNQHLGRGNRALPSKKRLNAAAPGSSPQTDGGRYDVKNQRRSAASPAVEIASLSKRENHPSRLPPIRVASATPPGSTAIGTPAASSRGFRRAGEVPATEPAQVAKRRRVVDASNLECRVPAVKGNQVPCPQQTCAGGATMPNACDGVGFPGWNKAWEDELFWVAKNRREASAVKKNRRGRRRAELGDVESFSNSSSDSDSEVCGAASVDSCEAQVTGRANHALGQQLAFGRGKALNNNLGSAFLGPVVMKDPQIQKQKRRRLRNERNDQRLRELVKKNVEKNAEQSRALQAAASIKAQSQEPASVAIKAEEADAPAATTEVLKTAGEAVNSVRSGGSDNFAESLGGKGEPPKLGSRIRLRLNLNGSGSSSITVPMEAQKSEKVNNAEEDVGAVLADEGEGHFHQMATAAGGGGESSRRGEGSRSRRRWRSRGPRGSPSSHGRGKRRRRTGDRRGGVSTAAGAGEEPEEGELVNESHGGGDSSYRQSSAAGVERFNQSSRQRESLQQQKRHRHHQHSQLPAGEDMPQLSGAEASILLRGLRNKSAEVPTAQPSPGADERHISRGRRRRRGGRRGGARSPEGESDFPIEEFKKAPPEVKEAYLAKSRHRVTRKFILLQKKRDRGEIPNWLFEKRKDELLALFVAPPAAAESDSGAPQDPSVNAVVDGEVSSGRKRSAAEISADAEEARFRDEKRRGNIPIRRDEERRGSGFRMRISRAIDQRAPPEERLMRNETSDPNQTQQEREAQEKSWKYSWPIHGENVNTMGWEVQVRHPLFKHPERFPRLVCR